jgi:hypothetical protein
VTSVSLWLDVLGDLRTSRAREHLLPTIVSCFDWITPELAVGGCFAPDDAEQLACAHGVGAVVDLREEACDDALDLARCGIAFLHLPTPDNCGVALADLCAGVAFARAHLDAGHRVLIHCQHGIGRSALLALCVLVERGHAPLAALALAKDRRGVVSPSPSQFEAWVAWLREHGHTPPLFDDFAAIAYRHLRSS